MKLALACANDPTADVEVCLRTGYDGCIDLVARKPGTGDTGYWYLITLTKDGKVIHQTAVPPNLGFQLNNEGQIMLKKYGS